jgi:hypothetical protein
MENIEKQIEVWKKQFGTVFKVVASDGKECFLRKPERKDIAFAEAVGEMFSINYTERMVTNLWLGGDEEMKTDVGYLVGMRYQIANIAEFRTVEVLKL